MEDYVKKLAAAKAIFEEFLGTDARIVEIADIKIVFSGETVDNDDDLPAETPNNSTPAEPGQRDPIPASAFPDGVTPKFGTIESRNKK